MIVILVLIQDTLGFSRSLLNPIKMARYTLFPCLCVITSEG